MIDVRHLEADRGGLAGRERHGPLEALAELAAERLAADELLVAAHPHCVRRDGLPRGRGRLRVSAGVDVYELDDEVRVRPRRRDVEAHFDGAGDDEVVVQRLGLVGENVRALGGEALVFGDVIRGHPADDVAEEGDGPVRVAHVLVESVLAFFARRLGAQAPG